MADSDEKKIKKTAATSAKKTTTKAAPKKKVASAKPTSTPLTNLQPKTPAGNTPAVSAATVAPSLSAKKEQSSTIKAAKKTTTASSTPVLTSVAPKGSVQKKAAPAASIGLWPTLLLSLLFGFGGGFAAIELTGSGNGASSEQIVLRESEVISDIAKSVGPSVVSISVETNDGVGFFGNAFTQESAGTGIVISADGYILTNKHVIPESTATLTIVLSDGTRYDDVTVVGRDPFNDIAFLKVNGVTDLTPAPIGDSSNVKVGDKVIAIGNALGEFDNTVTSGIISGLSRPIIAGDGTDAESLQNLFQTDASINPGNSGGPLVNVNGEVIGINTAVAGDAENIGFSIPINDAKSGIVSVIEEGELIKPYLGVRYITVSDEIAEILDLPANRGAYLDDSAGEDPIIENSPADKAGLRGGDIIIRVNGLDIDENNSLITLVSQSGVGDTVVLTVIRNDDEQDIDVILEAVPDGLR